MIKSSKSYYHVKWRKCLIIHNNNKKENQPENCKTLYNLYIKELRKEEQLIKNFHKYNHT
jgi:hypothetical protein